MVKMAGRARPRFTITLSEGWCLRGVGERNGKAHMLTAEPLVGGHFISVGVEGMNAEKAAVVG